MTVSRSCENTEDSEENLRESTGLFRVYSKGSICFFVVVFVATFNIFDDVSVMLNILAQMLIYKFLFEASAGGDVCIMISTTCFYRQRRLLSVFLLLWKLLRLSGVS